MTAYKFRTVSTIVIVLSAVAWGSAAEPVATLDIGASAPPFELPGVDGKTYKLHDFDEAEILVVIFTCNHCPTARAFEDRIKQLVVDYKDKGVAFVAISPNDPKAVRLDELGYTDLSDSFEEMKIRAEYKKYNFPYLYDGDKQETARAYGPVATPHVFIFDRARKLRFVGRVEDSEVEKRAKVKDARNALDAMLAGKPVPVEKTKVFGCSIKWSDKRGSVIESLARWAAEEVSVDAIGKGDLTELLANQTENLLLVNVWATWCGPCVAEFPDIVATNRMYRNRQFELITLSADEPDNRDKVLAFLKKQEASMRNYLYESDNKYEMVETVDRDWNGAIPYTMLIRPGGEIVYRCQGAIDPIEVRRAIVEHLGARGE